MAEYIKKRYTAEGTVCVKGQNIPYTAVSEDFPICNAEGEAEASIFMYSYERSDIADKTGRPVLFGWNGGPGCCSVYVHMGMLAPERLYCGEKSADVAYKAPFRVVNNDNCLLDICDVVSVDAIGTGYSRLLKKEAKESYHNSDGDARATVIAMRKWLTAHKRWNSPVYIMGESYGTIRNALVAEAIFGHDGPVCSGTNLHLAGVIMLGSALNHAQQDFPVPREVMNLPSMAAANWYWHPEGKGSLEDYMRECEEFSYGDYLTAIALGDRLAPEKQLEVAKRLSSYCLLPVEKLMEDKLRIDWFTLPARAMAPEGKTISIYDARFALGKTSKPESFDFGSDDPCGAMSQPAFVGAYNAIWKDRLNIDTDEEYETISYGFAEDWDFRTKIYPPTAMERAMFRNPGLKLMFGMGVYDLLTTVGWVKYLVSHYDYPKDRLWMKYYNSGHMPYLGDSCAYQLLEDIKQFILAEKNTQA